MGKPANNFTIIYAMVAALMYVTSSEPEVKRIKASLLVETTTGPVKGTVTKGYTNKEVITFHGIPYAEPPVKELRFKPPVPVKPWTEVLDATKPALPCYQQYTVHAMKVARKYKTLIPRPWTEDCLTINIWSAVEVADDSPVVIFFHTGNYLTGSGAYPHLDFGTMAAEAEVLYLTLNYRLGAFGFMSYGVPESPGNMGLMDQQLAIKWIHDNIGRFGGKTEAVFFAGHGAGASSIGFQFLSPRNLGFFKTISLVSGAPTCPGQWHPLDTAINKAQSLARKLGCEKDNTTETIECLRNCHPEDIIDADRTEFGYESEQFKPTIDGDFLSEPPLESLKAGRFNNATVITSTTTHEGSILYTAINSDLFINSDGGLTDDGFHKSVNKILPSLTRSEIDIIEDWYLGDCDSKSPEALRDAAVSVYSDALTHCCVKEFLDYATMQVPYTYQIIMAMPDTRLPAWMGATSDTTLLLFTGETLNPKHGFSVEDGYLSLGLMKVAGIFTRKRAWSFTELCPKYEIDERPYLRWETGERLRTHDFRGKECKLWNEILPSLRKGNEIQQCNNSS